MWSTLLKRGNLGKKICKFYVSQMKSHPLRTKSITSAIIFALGDFFAQKIERCNNFGKFFS